MTTAITRRLLQDLVAGTHAEGITALAVEAAIDRDDRTLLIAEDGAGFTDLSWQLPGGPVQPGQTLTDALHATTARIGLSIDQITGYLGHHDRTGARATRVFCFAVTVTDPDVICQYAGTGHRWAATDDLAGLTASTPGLPARAPAAAQPPLAGPLRDWARGIYPDEAGVELLISHATFLHRADFTSRFISTTTSSDGTGLAAIDWPAAITALGAGLPCSGGEQRILRLAASLASGIPVNLRDALTGIDDRGIQLVIKAVQHASGQRPPPGFHDHY
jgi:8-oxo-dGTP diphosphatase